MRCGADGYGLVFSPDSGFDVAPLVSRTVVDDDDVCSFVPGPGPLDDLFFGRDLLLDPWDPLNSPSEILSFFVAHRASNLLWGAAEGFGGHAVARYRFAWPRGASVPAARITTNTRWPMALRYMG